MLPNKNLNKGVTNTSNFVGSRAYTFIDSYVNMKNRNYNALYEKNKNIFKLENKAINTYSPKLLYDAFVEQMRILDSVVVRILDFTIRIREEVENNIASIMPSNQEIAEFSSALDKTTFLPMIKYVKYNIEPIEYTNLTQFFNLYKNEIKEFCSIKDMTANVNTPLLHSKATNFLTNTAAFYANNNDSLLDMEEIKVMTKQRLQKILTFFQKKNTIVSNVRNDFKTFQFYLKQYKILHMMTECIKPIIISYNQIDIDQINIEVDSKRYLITFNDYIVLYKHFSAICKYLLDIINYYNNKFFNKIYAIQSNIEVYKSIMRDVIGYANTKDTDDLNESAFNDLYGMINGNSEADELLIDDTSDSEDEKDDIDYRKDEIENIN